MMDKTVPAAFTRAALHDAYAQGLSPAAVLTEVYRRIDALADPGIFLHLAAHEHMLAQADNLPPFDPEAQPLWGLPCAIKDNIDVAGMPTTCACPAFAYCASQDAAAVQRLRAAGALILGKTNLDQFATGLVGVRTPYPVPRNAIDDRLVPGGSSSGSAIAVARGLLTFTLGTDTAGSGRVPAALNGIVGWKPSCGSVSTRGVVPACRSLDCVSVFAGNVDDAWQVYASIAAYDADDPFARRRPALGWHALPAGFTVGVPREDSRRFFGDPVQAAAFARDLDHLSALGADLCEIDFTPFYEVADLLYGGAWLAERLAAIVPFADARPGALHPVTAAIIEPARALSAQDAFDDLYRLRALTRLVEQRMAACDVLAVPSIPRPVTLEEIAVDPVRPNRELGTYTNFANLLDLCAVTLPSGSRADGLPGSLTLLARGGEDGRLLPLARALTGAPAPSPQKTRGDAHELVVVGAHLSGMPLNHQLTARGGRLLRAVRTQACYRLYALPGAPPRPGLMRVAEGTGHAIETEVWALSPAAFGDFVASIGAPLGFGRVRLEDGSAPTGFIVEPEGIIDAEEISHFGGWRAYRSKTAAS